MRKIIDSLAKEYAYLVSHMYSRLLFEIFFINNEEHFQYFHLRIQCKGIDGTRGNIK